MTDSHVLVDVVDGVATLTLNRPARHNALVPDLMDALNAALDGLSSTPPAVLVLRGAGRSFSTGGDIVAFAGLPRGERRTYAARLVGALNEAILKLLALPCPVIAAVHGPVTGGSCGFVFASDLVVMGPRAFLQSYYVDVGFSPDGGWTALLPERIGPARAGAIQMLNRRIGADEALALGIAQAAPAANEFEAVIAGWLGTLRSKVAPSLAATRSLLMPPERLRAIADGLERERSRFLDLIETDETEAGMARFLARAA
ncbi:MAG: enoyl-CoA hydratase/isomerase family protein [Phreatobacter sp.]|uniref:enoyl-CoA hydratase/isomerase family protein n=1 Tax=Phreatobacter sp. TaxID=1966341 RepID=UPI001A542234|nr:enoyl-CoA hydratase/isomerase family protein [Phreatobacter sp.]MBL8571476.1 enoyl-CoA hydratase/isomerase family protein [Phreatobacter sp.]